MKMHFGFSYVGIIYLIMLFVPNIIWAKNKPENYDQYVKNENKILLALERTGEVLCSAIVLVFADFNLRSWTLWSLWLIASFALMILYELYWFRYFKSEKTMRDQYSSFCGFPVAGATLPVVAFFLLGIYGINIWLIVATIILGIGHICIHLAHEKEVNGPKKKHIVKRILKGLGAVVLISVFAIIAISIGARDVRFLKHQANYINGAEEQTFITLGGQEQYVLMTGRNVENPVIIYLHGGPASPDTMVMYAFADLLMDDYTFIGWDQRGAGRTYYHNMSADPENETASFEQSLSDLDELVDYARERFGQDKVIIMGHSYGTVLGSTYVLEHPEKVSEYIGVGQVVSASNGDLISYEDALQKAKAAGDDTSEMETAYETFMADSTLKNMISLRDTVSKYHPGKEANVVWLGMSSPYFGIDDMKWFIFQVSELDAYLELNSQLFDYIMTFEALDGDKDFEVPVHFISGAEDWVCPVELVKEYEAEISAPQKDITLIDACGHSPQEASPKEFAEAVNSIIKRR
ncbi:MAG: alpha/beta hydrolase [Lachnospiraceae bacterium]|nr:alpha/beta hydrolase [Lachnospiraceae bacterium]